MQDKPEKRLSPHRKSPPREIFSPGGVVKEEEVSLGVNPERSENPRTRELATDQSIAARNLLYNPNESCLEVMRQCADGIGSIMDRMKHTGNEQNDLVQDKVLISMCTRLMADGGTGRIIGFNDRLKQLVEFVDTKTFVEKDSKPENYDELLRSLANDCRARMSEITSNAKKPGPEGAVARQGILSFMGDLGGIEEGETGFGAAYKGPLEKPEYIYITYAAGLCDAQRKLAGQSVPATDEEVLAFEEEFRRSRAATSMKGGGLSAPAHTARKKEERAPLTWAVQERQGLLNTGDLAEEKLKTANKAHEKSLVDAAWPSYLVAKAITQDVVEPVTGHVSGTFGEMATTMNMFCGTPPATIFWETPSGTPIDSANKDQTVSIAAMAAAGLITAGFHSAVEIFQPMSTFTTHATHESIGPKAVEMMNKQAKALKDYAAIVDTFDDGRPKTWGEKEAGYPLSEDELILDKESLLSRAEGIEDLATKSVDMISMLQGDGGTLATLEIARVLANQSVDPQVPFKLYSLNTRLDELGLRGHTPELEKARTIANMSVSETQQQELAVALKAAENAADNRDFLHKNASEAEEKAAVANTKVEVAEIMLAGKQEVLTLLTNETNEVTQKGWRAGASAEEASEAMKQLGPLEKERKSAFRAVAVAKLEVTATRAEAEAASKEAFAAKAELTSIDESVVAAAKAEAVAARKEATAARKEVKAGVVEAIAEDAEAKATKAEQIAAEKQQALDLATIATQEATRIGWGEGGSPEDARKARDSLEALEDVRKQAFREAAVSKKEAIGPREIAKSTREEAIRERGVATDAKVMATQARAEAAITNKEASTMIEKSKTLKERMHNIKESDNPESPEVKSGPGF